MCRQTIPNILKVFRFPQSLRHSVAESRPPKFVGLWQASLFHRERPSSAFLPAHTLHISPATTATFPWLLLVSKGICAVTSPRADGCTGRSTSRNDTAHSREKDALKRVLHYLLVVYQTQEQLAWKHRNFLWRMHRVLLKSSPHDINYTSYAKSASKGAAQTQFTPTNLTGRLQGLEGNGNCVWLSWCVWSPQMETHLKHSVFICHRLPRKFTDTYPKYICISLHKSTISVKFQQDHI